MSEKRDGYAGPNFTPVPNQFFDEDLDKLDTVAEARVLLFIFRQTYGWQKHQDAISLSQIENGVVYKNGARASNGVGLHKATICRALKSLDSKGLLRRERRCDDKRGDLETLYTPVRPSPTCSTDAIGGVAATRHGGVSRPQDRPSRTDATPGVARTQHTKERSLKEIPGKKSIDPVLDFEHKKSLLIRFIEGHPDYSRLIQQLTDDKAKWALEPTARYFYDATFALLKDRVFIWGPNGKRRPRDWAWFRTIFENHIAEYGVPADQPAVPPQQWGELMRKTKLG